VTLLCGHLWESMSKEFMRTSISQKKLIKKLTKFYVECLLPAIMTGNVSSTCHNGTQDETSVPSSDQDDQIFCYCRGGEYWKGDTM